MLPDISQQKIQANDHDPQLTIPKHDSFINSRVPELCYQKKSTKEYEKNLEYADNDGINM